MGTLGIPILSNIDDLAETIANPNPQRPAENAIGNVGRALCQAASNNPVASGVDTFLLAGAASLICKPYWDAEGWDAPVVEDPGFSGGQCAGVQYIYRITSATINYRGCPGPFFSLSANNLPLDVGPIQGPITKIEGKSALSNPVFCASLGVNHYGDPRIYVTGANGTASAALSPGNNGANVESIDFVGTLIRVDGQPDNCGDPPDNVEPGPTPAPPITPPPGSGWDIDVRGNPIIVLPPTLEISPGLTVDVGDISPEINFGRNGKTGPADLGPGDQGTPGDEVETGMGGDDSGEAPEGSILTGLRLRLIEAPPNPNQFETGIYRGGAYVFMGGDAGLDMDFAGSNLTADQFIHAETDNATRWRVISSPLFSWGVTPYYR